MSGSQGFFEARKQEKFDHVITIINKLGIGNVETGASYLPMPKDFIRRHAEIQQEDIKYYDTENIIIMLKCPYIIIKDKKSEHIPPRLLLLNRLEFDAIAENKNFSHLSHFEFYPVGELENLKNQLPAIHILSRYFPNNKVFTGLKLYNGKEMKSQIPHVHLRSQNHDPIRDSDSLNEADEMSTALEKKGCIICDMKEESNKKYTLIIYVPSINSIEKLEKACAELKGEPLNISAKTQNKGPSQNMV